MGVTSYLLKLSAVLAGTAFALPAAEPPLPFFLERADNATISEFLVRRAQAINYNQNYVASGANVQYSPNQGAGSYTISYNTNQDFVCGLGWNPGNSDPITYSGSFSASGVGILTVYGWTTNPLIEYYIMETSTGYPKSGQQKGTVTSDGSSYEIWQHQQTNQPSIQGTSTFQQYISIRSSQRSSGTVTVANHFNAWKAAGMNLGTQNFQVMAVESWSGSGRGSITLSKGTSGGSTGGGAPTTTATGSQPTSGGGGNTGGGTSTGGSAHWGQCGGSGWTGPTTCQSPYTCQYSNQWYSQCL